MKSQRMVSITSDEFAASHSTPIPDDIIKYRGFEKDDLLQKVWEAREEIQTIKNSPPLDKEVVFEQNSKKDHYALASELYKLKDIIKDLRGNKHGQVISRENGNSPEKQGKKRGRPSKTQKT